MLFRHAFRNALIPIITLIGLSLPAIAGGAVITETVFNYPGMGLLTFRGPTDFDVNVVVATTVVATAADRRRVTAGRHPVRGCGSADPLCPPMTNEGVGPNG